MTLRFVLNSCQVLASVVLVGVVGLLLAGTLPAALGYESWVDRGDLAVIAPVRADSLRIGDVVVYRRAEDAETVVVRRLLYVDRDNAGRLALQTRGDDEAVADQIVVAPTAQLGRVAYRLPRLGVFVDVANAPAGRLVLFGLPLVLLGLDYLRRDKRSDGPLVQDDRAARLVDAGARALAAGHTALALQAAAGALQMDPHSQTAKRLADQARSMLSAAA